MRRKKWIVSKGDKDLASEASQELGIDPIAAIIVTSRTVKDLGDLEEFFDEDAPLTLDPTTIKDMDKAAARVIRAMDSFEKICVYGDYDADGVTSTALLFAFLESRGANVISYIPDRVSEGYGLNNNAIKSLSEQGVKLIVTVDNGISAIEEIKYAYSLGMEVVVTDHHMVGDELPQCEAVVDPHRSDCPSNFKEMSGVGVAFKLCCAIDGDGENELLDEYGEYIALGTIGDVVSLTGENRVMVRRGIKQINESPCIGIEALLKAAGVSEKIFTSSVAAYTLCPRINAAGRMGNAQKALDLLLCDDEIRADELAHEIQCMNTSRQKVENEIYEQALQKIAENPEIANGKIIVVDGEGWHQGVIGIVAAKIMEHFGRPAIVISIGEDEAKGSCRSIEGISIYEAIDAVSDCLTHFGGHTLAAGIGLKKERISEFRKRINDYVADKEMPFATQRIDLKINPSSVKLDLLSSLACLEPYGAGNPQPYFGLFGVKIEEITSMSDGKHTRLLVSKNDARIGAIFFSYGEKSFPFERGDIVDLAVNLERNFYNGEAKVSVVIRGIRPSVTDEEKVLKAISTYNKFCRNEKITPEEVSLLLPDRDAQVQVFKCIKARPLKDNYSEQLCVRLHDDGSKLGKYMISVDVMLEMGILVADGNRCISVPEKTTKVNLEDSAIMKKLRSI